MPTLFCFGLGYSASHYIAEFGRRFHRIAGTVTTREKATAIAAAGIGGHTVDAFVFDGSEAPAQIATALTDTTALLTSAPPGERGDPVLAHFADTIATAANLKSIVYLSTVGVYGDHGGAWVDEDTVATPVSERSRERLAAEQAWQALGARTGKPVAMLRLSGIYGPGQNALVQVAGGRAKRIDKAGQVFNRIHVEDIAQTIAAAFTHRADGVFNVTDDEPTPQGSRSRSRQNCWALRRHPRFRSSKPRRKCHRSHCHFMVRASASRTTSSSANLASNCAILTTVRRCARCSGMVRALRSAMSRC